MTLQTRLLLAADGGEHLAFLNTRATVKVGGDRTGGVMTVIEILAPRGWGPPLQP